VSAAILSGNTLYIGGNFTRLGPPTGGWVGLGANTGARRSELPRVAGSVAAILADGSGGWYLGGKFSAVGNAERHNLAHIRADGTLDPSWVMDTNGEVNALVLSGNFLYVGGGFTTLAGQARTCVAAINVATGGLASWAPSIWRSAGVAAVYALWANGHTIYVGGYFDQAGGAVRSNLAALDANSASALAWNPAPNSSVFALALYGGKLYVGGYFSQIGGQSRNYLAAVDTTTGNATAWNPSVGGGGMFPSVSSFHQEGDLLYIGGQFSQIGGFARNCLAALNLTNETITAWDPNITDSSFSPRVSALAVSGNTVYVGGHFTQAGGQTRNCLAAVNAASGAVTAWNPEVNDYVAALAASGDTVFAGGSFTALGGVARGKLAALDITSGEPTGWAPVVNGTSVSTLALSGNTLYLGGLFSQVGGQTRGNVAAVDITTGAVLGWNPNANNWVNVLVTNGATVFAGGSFVTIGGQSRFNLAALNPTTGLATSWQANTNGPSVYDLTLSGSVLFVAGYFTSLSSQTRNNLAAFNAGSGATLSWNPDVGGYLGPYDDPVVWGLSGVGNTLFVGGHFSEIAGQERHNLAALDTNTAGVLDWNPGTLQEVKALTGDGGTIYAGGAFLAAADQPQAYIAGLATVSVQTNPASSVSLTSATLNGAVTAYFDAAATAAFEWGATPGGPYPNELAASPSPVGSTHPVTVTALLPTPEVGLAYYYRLRATTIGGSQVYGSESSFRLGNKVYLPNIVR
jgi:hypothetical protein